MTLLDDLKKEAWGLFEVAYANYAFTGRQHDPEIVSLILTEIVTRTYSAAVEACVEALPEEKTMAAALKAGSDAGAGDTIGHNYYRKEALFRLKNLLPEYKKSV